MRQSKLKSWGAVLCCASLLVTTVAWAQNPALGRDYEPVVVPGWHLADWNGVEDLTLLNLYKYVGNGQFETIPFQIDKRRNINLRWNRHNLANGKFPTTNVCEYGYFAEKNVPAEPDDPLYQGTYLDPFLSDILHDKDEIVFLFKDSGVLRADNTEWVSPSSTSIKRYEFILSDLRTHAVRYVYAFLWNQTPVPKSTTNYVSWTPELNPLACTSDEPLEACGVIESQASQLPGLNTFAAHFGGNWITDRFNVKEGGHSLFEHYRAL
ncbi:MAG: hypothetical protein IFK94_15200 [Acidobacteria bacterium]|uniref:Uncharacterized protein n=1 Tax=Candidatus Polarisedimenticola svalbardensis TaxID=2886004 RepID=A0A8J6Y334_9BACT|nr:hypothetical protein [Candidatus Polarisedimenticola svalbardensis]